MVDFSSKARRKRIHVPKRARFLISKSMAPRGSTVLRHSWDRTRLPISWLRHARVLSVSIPGQYLSVRVWGMCESGRVSECLTVCVVNMCF